MSAPIFQDDILFYQRLLKASGYYNDTLDGRWGGNTDAADQAFVADSAQLATRLGTFDSRTEKNIATLHIKAQELARQFMQAVAGFEVTVKIRQKTAIGARRITSPTMPTITSARAESHESIPRRRSSDICVSAIPNSSEKTINGNMSPRRLGTLPSSLAFAG